MIVTRETSLEDFEGWGGAETTLEKLTDDEKTTLENIIEEQYPNGIDETRLNDILRFEDDWIGSIIGRDINEEDDDEDED